MPAYFLKKIDDLGHNIRENKLILLLAGCLLAIFLGVVIKYTDISLQNVKLIFPNGQYEQVHVPYYVDDELSGMHIFKSEIFSGILQQKTIKIFTTGCFKSAKINQSIIFFEELNSKEFCNGENGIDINIGKYLKRGLNSIEFGINFDR